MVWRLFNGLQHLFRFSGRSQSEGTEFPPVLVVTDTTAECLQVALQKRVVKVRNRVLKITEWKLEKEDIRYEKTKSYSKHKRSPE